MFPSCFILLLNSFREISSYYSVILRLKNRKNYFRYYLNSSVMILSYFFFILLFIVLIFVNVTPHTNILLTNEFGYNIYDFCVFIVCLLRLYLSIIFLFLFTSLLLFNIKEDTLIIILMFIFMMIIFLNSRIRFNHFPFTLLNLDIYFFNISWTTSIFELLLFNVGYYIIFYLILYIEMKKSFFKSKYIGVKKND